MAVLEDFAAFDTIAQHFWRSNNSKCPMGSSGLVHRTNFDKKNSTPHIQHSRAGGGAVHSIRSGPQRQTPSGKAIIGLGSIPSATGSAFVSVIGGLAAAHQQPARQKDPS